MKPIQFLAVTLGVTFALTATAETFRYSGVVVDAEDQPIIGATVDYWEGNTWGPKPAEIKEKQSTTSGTNGTFEFTLSQGYGQMIARKPGLAPAWKQLNPQRRSPDSERRFILTQPTTLAGTVVDEAGKPVSDAEVFVTTAVIKPSQSGRTRQYDYLRGPQGKKEFSTRSGADGHFRIEGFPTNAVADLSVSKAGVVLCQKQRAYFGVNNMMGRSGQQDIKLMVEPAGGLEARIVGAEGSVTLTNARLWLQPDDHRSFTEEPAQLGTNGLFTFSSLAPGSYHLSAVFGTNAVADWVAESVPVTVTAGETTRDVRVAVVKGGFLEATVVSSVDHKPIAGATINVFAPNYNAGATTATNGLALFRLPPGEFQVSANQGQSRTAESAAAKIEMGQTNRVQLELAPPPTISGRVLNPDGTPAAGLTVSIMPDHGMNSSITTDTNGHYELQWRTQNFGGSPPAYCLLVRDTTRNLAVAQDIDESTTKVDLQLVTGQTIAGRVEDPNGKPLTNAMVHLVFWTGNSGAWIDQDKIKIDAQGRFEDAALPRDRKYGVGVDAKGYASAQTHNLQDAGERIDVPAFALKLADKQISGRVIDADEKPVANASISTYGEGQPQLSISTDEKGLFSFGVCEGSIQISAYASSASGSATAQAGDTNVVITMGVRSDGMPQVQRRRALTGSALPDLATVGLASDAAPAGKPVLLCFFDAEQRPSRRFVKQLAEQHEALRQKGVTLLGVQAALTTADALKEWKTANPVPFPVGSVAEKSSKTKWVLDIETLPWLILTDAQGKVTAEGFGLDELDAKLSAKR